MSETEAPLTPIERLVIVGLYATLTLSQNRSVTGQFAVERSCYADHDIHRPETLSHKGILVYRGSEGFETGQAAC
ncbi:Uncharacterised protein [Mycobacteroides abscessus subsp. abscessus]|uniref:hypothetical protein n=1 Tax=Mycobacteroides abscessus TaxID=36809 RepID=UPI0009A7CC23|nr:hypothetical protein [Mycobacteroides abscessus]MBN7388531.1 hypothetical protein [Mycobacteroides abscessus subsp. abscessus]MBN7414801.1 hypothetical protein [Mycobacteroides abscessus subsp. abscessus]MDO2961048.1 hypothetical protein [Mycobacteroides abscessus subsp. abscessus]MDO2995016.1 hypothetical protein [Mycobacteroides abscessus subsp. abscessus]MDO3064331.1 hypothetical protein [Mycobacteroides abscessus subsp. abscessus]